MKSKQEIQPPILIRRGRVVHATYEDPLIPDYRGNPLIEALPPILSKEEATKILACFPKYEHEQRMLPTHLRLHLLQSITKFFMPSGTTLRLEQQISVMIRSGLVGRNPVEPGFWGDLEHRVKATKSQKLITSEHSTKLKASGLTAIGISGIGKSTTIERILLEIYPQVIIHSRYKGRKFTHVQIVYLHIDCPANGSLKSLCQSIVQAIDDLTGEDYYTFYNCDSRTAENLVPIIARIASFHSLGLLVIDEIQNLSEARSGGSDIVLNFNVKLINDIGVPIIWVGTYKAMDVLGGKLRQARRGSGPSDLIWTPMKDDPAWKRLVAGLAKYQFIRNPSFELDQALISLLHYESQGITDIGIKLFLLSQIRLMTTAKNDEEEILTEAVIKSVASDSLTMVRPMLNALKNLSKSGADQNKMSQELKKFEDIYIDIQPYITQAEEELIEFSSSLEEEPGQQEVPTNQESEPPSAENSQESNASDCSTNKHSRSKNMKNSSNAEVVNVQPSVLQQAIDAGVKQKLTAYQALQKSGFIKTATEFETV